MYSTVSLIENIYFTTASRGLFFYFSGEVGIPPSSKIPAVHSAFTITGISCNLVRVLWELAASHLDTIGPTANSAAEF